MNRPDIIESLLEKPYSGDDHYMTLYNPDEELPPRR